MSDDKENRFIAYCLKKGYISMEKAKILLKAKGEKSIILLVAREFGWDKKKVTEVIQEMQSQERVTFIAQEIPSSMKDSGFLTTWNEKNSSPPEPILNHKDTSQEHDPLTLYPDQKKFGPYIILKKLGQGAAGEVHLAYDPRLKRYIAIKMLLAGEAASENQIERFLQEARAAARLHHPNIVPVHNIEKEGKQNYFTMDYIDGESLSQAISKERFAAHRAMYILLKIAEAMHYAHTEGIIHRDLKPANIILDRSGEPHVTDFGLAKEIHGGTKLSLTGIVIGTPAYIPPEQAHGKWSDVDAKSDVYSLGAVLYEILTQHPPFEGSTAYEIISKVISEDPIPPHKWNSKLPKDAETICIKALEKDKNRRYSSAEELAQDIGRYLEGKDILAISPGYLYRLWRKTRRNLRTVVIVSVFFLIVIGLFILWEINAPTQVEIEISSLKKQAEELEKNGNLKGSAEIYSSIFKLDKGHASSRSALDQIKHKMLQKAFRHKETGDLNEASRVYNEILEIDKEYKGAKAGIGYIADKIEETWNKSNAAEKDKHFDEALALCKKLIEWNPKDERFGRYILELTQKKESCRKEARKYYDRAMEIFWNPRLDETELKRCKSLFEKAIEEDPSFADAHFQAGRASHRLFNTDETIKHYKNSLKQDPHLTPPKYYLTALELPIIVNIYEKIKAENSYWEMNKELEKKFGEIWTPGGNTEDSIITLEKNDPYSLLAKAQFILATRQVMFMQNRWEECLGYCNKVIQEYPNFSDAYLMRAQLYSYLIGISSEGLERIDVYSDPKNLDQALKDCSKVIYLDPYRIEGYCLRGKIYQAIGAYNLAEKDYTKILLLKHIDKAGIYLIRAICYLAMDKLQLAIADLNETIKYLKGTPDSFMKKDAFLAQMFVSAWAKDKKTAEESLNIYLSSTFRTSECDGFVKTAFYILTDDDNRAEDVLKSSIQSFDNFMKMFQLSIIAYKRGADDCFIQNSSLLLQDISNLLCLPPNIKKQREVLKFIKLLPTNFPLLQRDISTGMFEFSVLSRAMFEVMMKQPGGENKRRKIDTIFNKEYPPLTVHFLFSCGNYLSNQGKVQKMINLKKLPSAPLYYRRAIEYYLKAESANVREENLEKARQDLEAALELEPDFMEANYGLSTVCSLLSMSKDTPGKNSIYRDAAIYHLKRALETGWSHLEDYTLQDDDFKPLALGKEVSLETLRSWDKRRQENQRQIKEFKNKVEELISRGNTIGALRVLYNSEYSSSLPELVNTTEKNVMDIFIQRLEKEKEADLDHEIENLFGERGKTIWEWAKRKEKDSMSNDR